MKIKSPDKAAEAEKSAMAERMKQFGIPSAEMTESVLLALSAILEKLDDVSRELAQEKSNNAILERQADMDGLVAVPNRRAFMRRLSWAISMRERYNHPCCLLYFDLNNFKDINDAHGHAAGDDVIRHMAHILQESLRDTDFMARLSGDEFAIIMYHARLRDAQMRGKKIAARLARNPITHKGAQLLITAACGAYEVAGEDNPESALAQADAQMYLDKKKFKARVDDLIA